MNPVLVEVTRGGTVESRHRGAFCVVDGEGRVVMSQGDIEQAIFPRSSIKAIQALAFVESGAADQFALSEEEIALACSSHNGEPIHAQTAGSMLRKLGLDATALQCGSHWPMNEATSRELAASGETPCSLHNNCSGKHSGFMAYLTNENIPSEGYLDASHPLQQRILTTLAEVCDIDLSQAPVGIDGCAIPTWAVPIRHLAWGFARMARPHQHFSSERANAVQRISEAVFAHPYMVAGRERYDTRLMQAFPRRAFVKVGAEGVFCAFVPELGYGIAIKCDDGAFRGAEIILSAVLHDLGVISEQRFAEAGLSDLYCTPIRNRNGDEVGLIRRAF